ncbi:MAG: EF-P lysine aminoacylase GenX [Geobacter sp.]|nr:MAG: EF-P lysine aminoacylase GenX [Geobacter sp.]
MAGNWSLGRKRQVLQTRATIIQEIRHFFVTGGYLEVETPLRIPAPAPEAQIDAVVTDGWFLQTSPELCMKRMLAAGYERLFQICHCWRADERGRLHLTEFTMLEWYRTGSDYRDIMTDCEGVIRAVADKLGHGNFIRFRGRTIDIGGEWERLTVREAFARYGETSLEDALELDRFDEIMVEFIEPRLGMIRPTFIYDYPASRGALARLKADDSSVAERFELYIGGLELANAFSELNDPVEQRRRFEEESAHRARMQRKCYPLPEPFLGELDAMPLSAGIALGVDRLVMVLLDAARIDDVVAFTPEEL